MVDGPPPPTGPTRMPTDLADRRHRARLKRAELVSSTGAGALGAGLGALAVAYVGRYAVVLIVAGAVLHAWGMRERHRIEREGGGERVWWFEALYWSCWIALLIIAALIVARR
ncbi:MAG: hypothetical protein ABS52_04560 [Gemmatimonadetes bacterium SCN 70-22]|nr:MAG: hypothetical protein ABS52_04560 [Gemmatimonadetes bacterium SCN 70-22]